MNKILEKVAGFVEEKYKLIFILILFLAFFLNIYKIGIIPKGIDVDEAGMGYDAFCIANYGVDRYSVKNPVYFINFGDGQNALYTYLAAIFVKLFGLNFITIRIPALILSILEVVFVYLLFKEYKGKKFALLFMLIFTISPWRIMKARWSLESYLLSPFLVMSIYTFLMAIKKNKILLFPISGLLTGITLYSYALSYFIIPIFLLFTFIYLLIKKKVKIWQLIIYCIPLLILAVPLILTILVQKEIIGEIYSFISITKLPSYKEGIIKLSEVILNFGSLKHALWCDKQEFNAIPRYGNLYYFGTILMVFGMLVVIKNLHDKKNDKSFKFEYIMIFYFISNFIWSLLIENNTNRLNGIYIPATYFIIEALKYLYDNIKIVYVIFGTAYLYCFISFCIYYFGEYGKREMWLFDRGLIDIVKYIDDSEKEIYSLTTVREQWIFELFALEKSPFEIHDTYKVNENRKVYEFGNYHNYYIYDLKEDKFKIEEDAIYIVENDFKEDEFKEKGYTKEEYNNYYIYRK